MEISSISHIGPERLENFQPDLFITSLSHETRCTVIPKKLEALDCKKIVLYRDDDKVLKEYAYQDNLEYFSQKDYDMLSVGEDQPDVEGILKKGLKGEAKILFDCTSMPQQWYYEFFNWLGESQDDFSRVVLRFTYTLTAYVDDGHPLKVKKISEFIQGDNLNGKKKKALLLGLGHEAKVADAIHRIVKPDLSFLYYTDPPVDKRFVEKIFVNNHALIEATPIRNLIPYPVTNGQEIYQSLMDTILPLRDEYSILMIPNGPKIFSVASMLVQLGYPDIMIAYPRFKRTQVLDRQPWGKPVILDVIFEEEE